MDPGEEAVWGKGSGQYKVLSVHTVEKAQGEGAEGETAL